MTGERTMLEINVKEWREKWALMEREEDRWACEHPMTIEESVRTYLSLCHFCAPMLKETEEIFLPDREAYLRDWQELMRKLNVWLQKQNETATESA